MAEERQETTNQQDEETPAFTLPAEATEPCRMFILANAQVTQFISDFAGMAHRIENLIQTLSSDPFYIRAVSDGYQQYLLEEGENREGENQTVDIAAFLRAVADESPKAEQVIGPYIPLLNQMLLSRAVDNFLLYLGEVLLLMYKTKLGPVQASGTDIEEFIGLMTEQYVERTSMGGTQKLISDFKNTFDFRLFPKRGIVSASAVDQVITRRNVIVHNRGIASRYYLRNVPTPGLKVGDAIPLTWDDVRVDVVTLVKAALDIDERLSTQFNLPRLTLLSATPSQMNENSEQAAASEATPD